MEVEIKRIYGDRLRVRICGICFENNKLLLLNHRGIGEKGSLWAPPGGGLEFGESIENGLIREFKEETGLDITVKNFLFVNELLIHPLHAIELFFMVEPIGGKLNIGTDPEMSPTKQIIAELKYWSIEDINKEDPLLFHAILRHKNSFSDITSLQGFLKPNL